MLLRQKFNIINDNVYSLDPRRTRLRLGLGAVVAVMMIVVTGLTNFELLIEIPAGRWGSITFD